MLIIKATGAREKISVWGEVPEHPDVKDVKPFDWSQKPIRPIKVKADFSRVDGGEWEIGNIAVYGFDVLKSGKPSDNQNCYRELTLYSYQRERNADLAWAYDWATIELARINDVTERADLDSDVVLGEPADLDDLDNAVTS